MTGTIIFNGTSSEAFGLIVEQLPPSVHAPRRGDLISIPGRNGVIVREDGSFETYQQEYKISFSEAAQGIDPYETARDIAVWLLGTPGFHRLEDGFEPDYFRMARYSGEFNVDTMLMEYGKATLTFDVQPQRYLKSGETPLTFTGGSMSSIVNPTQFEARPLLKFTDTSTTPEYVSVSLNMRNVLVIDKNGNVVGYEGAQPARGKVSDVVNVEGKANAKITGNGAVFYDSNGETRGGGFIPSGKIQMNEDIVHIPDWAVRMRVSCGQNDTASLALQDPRANPGASAVNINGITVNLDFSAQDTIFLDCDLHDAYYADGSNANAMVSFSSTVVNYPTFPGLSPGANSIIPGDGSILDFELTPRWWTL